MNNKQWTSTDVSSDKNSFSYSSFSLSTCCSFDDSMHRGLERFEASEASERSPDVDTPEKNLSLGSSLLSTTIVFFLSSSCE